MIENTFYKNVKFVELLLKYIRVEKNRKKKYYKKKKMDPRTFVRITQKVDSP